MILIKYYYCMLLWKVRSNINSLFTITTVGARLYFHRHVWFCSQGGGVCLSACRDITPQTRYPNRPGPLDQAPSQCRACWEIQSTHGQYASYWNAILLPSANEVMGRKCFHRSVFVRKVARRVNRVSRSLHRSHGRVPHPEDIKPGYPTPSLCTGTPWPQS